MNVRIFLQILLLYKSIQENAEKNYRFLYLPYFSFNITEHLLRYFQTILVHVPLRSWPDINIVKNINWQQF